MPDEKLLAEFDEAMHDIYHRALKKAGCKASIFLDMLFKYRGLDTARRLIDSQKAPSSATSSSH
jgi:hypothetical protein